MSIRLKSKIFKMVVRPAILYHSELWAPKAADLESLRNENAQVDLGEDKERPHQ